MNVDLGEVIGLVGAIMSLSIPIIYIVMRSRRLQKAMELVHAQRMAAIERGMELPPASLDFGLHQTRRGKPRTALLPGLMWLFVGLAIFTASMVAHRDAPPIFVGLIPIGIGLAYLIYYFIEERKTLDQTTPSVASAVVPQAQPGSVL
jgi:hypothetical protein